MSAVSGMPRHICAHVLYASIWINRASVQMLSTMSRAAAFSARPMRSSDFGSVGAQSYLRKSTPHSDPLRHILRLVFLEAHIAALGDGDGRVVRIGSPEEQPISPGPPQSCHCLLLAAAPRHGPGCRVDAELQPLGMNR